MLSPEYDWDTHDSDDYPEKLFRECTQVGWPENEEESKKYVECGSVEAEDTAKGLYRLFYLLKPKSVDFSDMYKNRLFGIFSADKRFLVEVYLFKYELGLYFFAPRETIKGEGSCVVAGWPGADNGWHCDDEDGNAFFKMVEQAADYTWDVYPGNDFKV